MQTYLMLVKETRDKKSFAVATARRCLKSMLHNVYSVV